MSTIAGRTDGMRQEVRPPTGAAGTTVGVPFMALGRQHRALGDEPTVAIRRVVEASSFTLGEEVEAFEREFAAFCGARHAVGVGSGTDALHLALRACGVGPGDEVITVVNTFAATAEAIVMCGARPVFVDIDEADSLMDVEQARRSVTERTRAIVPVHLYGRPCRMSQIRALAQEHGLAVVEDACQSHGARCEGGMTGALGDAGCFSFYPSKNLGAMGDGGCVVTNDDGIAETVRLLRNHGEDDARRHLAVGYCSRLHGMQAAILRVKLEQLESWNSLRRTAAQWYMDALADAPVELPARAAQDCTHVYHLFVIKVPQRRSLRRMLDESGIATGVHYPTPLHLEPAFQALGYREGDFPVAESQADRILSLPMYPFLRHGEVEEVADAIYRSVRILASH